MKSNKLISFNRAAYPVATGTAVVGSGDTPQLRSLAIDLK